jgi:hypothetical protein
MKLKMMMMTIKLKMVKMWQKKLRKRFKICFWLT